MAVVPSTRTWVAGEVVLDTHFNNNIRDVLNFLLAPPIFQGRQTVAQSLTSGTFTALTLDAEDVDSAGGHSTVSNTSRYTAVYAGWYDCAGGYTPVANATGRRMSEFRVNGAGAVNCSVGGGPAANIITGYVARRTLLFLNVNDYVELMGYQDSGGALNTFITNADFQSSMNVRWTSN